jgi:hypothetical protein
MAAAPHPGTLARRLRVIEAVPPCTAGTPGVVAVPAPAAPDTACHPGNAERPHSVRGSLSSADKSAFTLIFE